MIHLGGYSIYEIMKLIYLSIALSAMLPAMFLFSCNDSNRDKGGYSIYADIANAGFDTMYLFQLDHDSWKPIDSTKRNKKGHFEFSGSVEKEEYFLIGSKDKGYGIRLFVENSPITIKGNFDEPGAEFITGSKVHSLFTNINDSLKRFNHELEALADEYKALQEEGDTAAMETLEIRYDSIETLKYDWLKSWTARNNNSIVGQYFILNPLSYTLDFEEWRKLLDGMDSGNTNNGVYRLLSEKVQIMENSSVGKKAPDFEMADTTGKMVKLSDFFGNYLLIDFWASWCGPCRVENPAMVQLYNDFHEKGYDVLGVSLDKDREKWLKAIKDDGLEWSHVSDLKGWANEGARIYGVSAIPHTVLIDPDGVIIARGLREKELRAKLESIFSEE